MGDLEPVLVVPLPVLVGPEPVLAHYSFWYLHIHLGTKKERMGDDVSGWAWVFTSKLGVG